MKRFKKLTSILLALVMMLAMSVTAFAANRTSTVQNGETYIAYQIFTKTSNDDAVSYSIAQNSAWVSVIKDYPGAKPNLTLSADSSKYLVGTLDETAVDAFAAYLAANIPDSETGTKVIASDTVVSFTNMPEGYYLITSSLGSTVATTNGSGTITLIEKNSKPTVDKNLTDKNDAYAKIGDEIGYTVKVNTGSGADKAITLTDTMSDSLTLNANSFSVKVDGETVASSNYTLDTAPGEGNTWTFKIVFSADYIKTLSANKDIVVTYSATLNENAVTVDAKNNAKIDYSNQTDTSEKTVKTNSFAVLKYAEGDNEKANLAGATFQLKQGNSIVKLIKESNTKYRVAMPNEEGAVDSFTTVNSNNIVIEGVDSDLVYTLVETSAPAGYNLLTTPVTVNVDATNSTVSEIANSTGSTLPTTGGMGTTLLYTVGVILVLGAGVALVVRRRMSAEK